VQRAVRRRAGALAVDANEHNDAALRFCVALGFSVVGRSPTDAGGRPFPILHLRRAAPDAPASARERG
jgi:putative acetyltransferase